MSDQIDPAGFQPAAGVKGSPVDIRPPIPDPEEFPLDRLPPRVSGAIQAIVDIVQVPVPIAAQSVLGALSLVAQTRVMIEMPTREVVPPSLFLFTVAASGDRKTSADKLALRSVYSYERDLRRHYEGEQHSYSIDKSAHDAALSKAKRDGGKDRERVKSLMEDCGPSPIPPALPMLLVEDPTIEGITKLLDEAYPSIGLFSDEGARMLGGYSMQEERRASTGASLSQLWDGKPIKRVRGSDVTKILDGRRASLHLMVQPGVAMRLFGDKELRDQGMMSRLLVAYPKSLKGQRVWREPDPAAWDALDEYHSRLENLLRHAFSFLDPQDRRLQLETVSVSEEARAMWIQFSDLLERQQGPGQPLEEVSDLASKMAQHALRLAVCVAYFEGGAKMVDSGLSAAAMSAGIAMAQYYLSESLRLYNLGVVDEDSELASVLIKFVHDEKLQRVGRRWLSRNGPKATRPARVLGRVIDLLVEHGHFQPLDKGAEFSARGQTLTERNVYAVIYPEDV